MERAAQSRRGKELLTPEEVAAYLKISRRTIYRLLKARKIPVFRIGGQWRFRRGELDEWLETKKIELSAYEDLPKV